MDEVSLPLHLLEQIKQTLTTAFWFSQTQDLQDSYRSLQGDAKWSKLTLRLSQQVELIQTFIDAASEDEEDAEADESTGSTK